MNSEGGRLLVGVDNGKICWVQRGFEAFEKNWDGWQQHLTNLIVNHFGTTVMAYIKPKLVEMDEGQVVLIEWQKAQKQST